MSASLALHVVGVDPVEAACTTIRAAPNGDAVADQSPQRGGVTIDLSGGKTRAIYDADVERIAAAWSDAGAALPTHITSLDFSVNRIGDRGATALANALRERPAQLLVLELDGNDLTDRSMDAIARMLAPQLAPVTSAADGSTPPVVPSAITRLDLSCNRITDKGIHELVAALYEGQNAALKTLLLRSNSFGDNGCQRLFAWAEDPICPLTTLHVSGNTCTEGVLPWLVQALRLNTSLTDLNASNTVPRISDMAPIREAMAQHNKTLLQLSLAFDGKPLKDADIEGCLRRNRSDAAKRRDAVEQLKAAHRREVDDLKKEIAGLHDQLADAHRRIAATHRE